MKETIMRIFGDPGAVGDEVKAPAIKEEVFYAGYRRGSNRRGGRGRGSRYSESMSSSNQRNENREPNTIQGTEVEIYLNVLTATLSST